MYGFIALSLVVRTGFEPVTSENPDWLQHIMLWPLSYLTMFKQFKVFNVNMLRTLTTDYSVTLYANISLESGQDSNLYPKRVVLLWYLHPHQDCVYPISPPD